MRTVDQTRRVESLGSWSAAAELRLEMPWAKAPPARAIAFGARQLMESESALRCMESAFKSPQDCFGSELDEQGVARGSGGRAWFGSREAVRRVWDEMMGAAGSMARKSPSWAQWSASLRSEWDEERALGSAWLEAPYPWFIAVAFERPGGRAMLIARQHPLYKDCLESLGLSQAREAALRGSVYSCAFGRLGDRSYPPLDFKLAWMACAEFEMARWVDEAVEPSPVIRACADFLNAFGASAKRLGGSDAGRALAALDYCQEVFERFAKEGAEGLGEPLKTAQK